MHTPSTGSRSSAGRPADPPHRALAHPLSRAPARTAALAAALVMALVTASAQAQSSTAQATPADPMDAKAAVPALRYQSAFEGYRPNVVQAPASWKDANDTAARKGGWRAYAREANAPEPEAAQPPGPALPASAPAAVTGPGSTPMQGHPPAHQHGGKR